MDSSQSCSSFSSFSESEGPRKPNHILILGDHATGKRLLIKSVIWEQGYKELLINCTTHKRSFEWLTKFALEASQSRRISFHQSEWDEKGNIRVLTEKLKYTSPLFDTIIFFESIDMVIFDETNFYKALQKILE